MRRLEYKAEHAYYSIEGINEKHIYILHERSIVKTVTSRLRA